MDTDECRRLVVETQLHCPDKDQFYKLFAERAYLLPDFCPSIVHRIDLADGNPSWVDKVGSKKWIIIKSPTASINSLDAIRDEVKMRDDRKKTIAFKVIDGKILQTYPTFEVILQVTDGIARWTIEYLATPHALDPVLYGGLLIDVSIAVDNHLVCP